MPTALDLTAEEREAYVRAARRQPAPAGFSEEARQEREALLTRVAEAARALKERFGPRRVVLFGSLAHQAWYTPDADVDLAVEGLAEGTFWEAWALVETMLPDRKVDFVEIELATDALRASIEAHGRAL